jgi:hypothetical protein
VMPKIYDVLKSFTSANHAAGPPKSKPFYVKSSKAEIIHRAGLHHPAPGNLLSQVAELKRVGWWDKNLTSMCHISLNLSFVFLSNQSHRRMWGYGSRFAWQC